MPKPIVCLSEQLRQYLELFRSCFSKPQWKYFVIVLLGLIECEERKTMTGLLRASHLPLLLCCLMPKRQARVRSVPILEDGDNPRVLPTSLRPQPIPRLQPCVTSTRPVLPVPVSSLPRAAATAPTPKPARTARPARRSLPRRARRSTSASRS